MSKRIIYTRPDGGLSVIVPNYSDRLAMLRADAVVRYAIVREATVEQERPAEDDAAFTASSDSAPVDSGEAGAPVEAVDAGATPAGYMQFICGAELVVVEIGDSKYELLDSAPDGAVALQALADGTPVPVVLSSALRAETDEEVEERVVKSDVPVMTSHGPMSPRIAQAALANGDIAEIGAQVPFSIVTEEEWAACDPDHWHRSTPAMNACSIVDGKPVVDLARARDVHLQDIRDERDRLLQALDAKELEALSKNDETMLAEVRAQKDELRAAPASIATAVAEASTPAALLAIRPTGMVA